VTADNIMFDSDAPDATLKLIDFGMTRFWNAKEREVLSSSIGTIVYNAPEVLDGHYNIHADMWSVGTGFMFFFCLSLYFLRGNSYESALRSVVYVRMIR